jgi:formylglycine-generating enzyme required for sulfatase activity
VPAGAFLMGSDPAHDKEMQDREKPQHWVTLAGFQIAKFPVTVAEYACFVRTGHAEPRSPNNQLTWQQQRERPDHPVVNVSWNDAVAYVAWLAKTTKQGWRLPSEAEWEKAARWDPAARTSRIYPWGDSFDKNRTNTHESGKGTTTPVGSYPNGASPCGAQDMAGNVWEWMSSLLKPYPYSPTDGREAQTSTENRVLRGGSWLGLAWGARAACRLANRPGFLNYNYGFRVVLAAPGSA